MEDRYPCDHKPMEAIAKKPINNTPNARKECYYSFKAMISRLLKNGEKMFFADTLSRAQLQKRTSTDRARQRLEVVGVHMARSPFAQESSTALADLENKESRNPSGHRPV